MNLRLDTGLAFGYKSKSQIARVLTEAWVMKNAYCPSCGGWNLEAFENNTPVGDFFCRSCEGEYELKSKSAEFGWTVVDGAYRKMIERIQAANNPHFFLLHYSRVELEVMNFVVIPNHFFVADTIQRRPPLAPHARRFGWVGCNILLERIPLAGRIYLVKNNKPEKFEDVRRLWDKTSFLVHQRVDRRSWTIEIMKILDGIQSKKFTLNDIYAFEPILRKKFPRNNFVREKIRQQLQMLRDKGILDFVGRGSYSKSS